MSSLFYKEKRHPERFPQKMLSQLVVVAFYLGCLATSVLGFGYTESGNSIIVTTDGGLTFTGKCILVNQFM